MWEVGFWCMCKDLLRSTKSYHCFQIYKSSNKIGFEGRSCMGIQWFHITPRTVTQQVCTQLVMLFSSQSSKKCCQNNLPEAHILLCNFFVLLGLEKNIKVLSLLRMPSTLCLEPAFPLVGGTALFMVRWCSHLWTILWKNHFFASDDTAIWNACFSPFVCERFNCS